MLYLKILEIKIFSARNRGLMPVILAIWETKSRKNTV
jgi:hypothetical protein